MTSTEMADLAQPDQTVVIEPGQTLILRFAQRISGDQAEAVKQRIVGRLPGVDVLVVGGCDQMIVYQPSTHPPADGPTTGVTT